MLVGQHTACVIVYIVPCSQMIIEKLGGSVASSEKAPNLSHVVYPFGPSGDPDDGKEYLRTLEFRQNLARVHYW